MNWNIYFFYDYQLFYFLFSRIDHLPFQMIIKKSYKSIINFFHKKNQTN